MKGRENFLVSVLYRYGDRASLTQAFHGIYNTPLDNMESSSTLVG